MKRFTRPTNLPAVSKSKQRLKALWKRLLTEDDLDGVEGGGSPKPITSGGVSIDDDGCGGG